MYMQTLRSSFSHYNFLPFASADLFLYKRSGKGRRFFLNWSVGVKTRILRQVNQLYGSFSVGELYGNCPGTFCVLQWQRGPEKIIKTSGRISVSQHWIICPFFVFPFFPSSVGVSFNLGILIRFTCTELPQWTIRSGRKIWNPLQDWVYFNLCGRERYLAFIADEDGTFLRNSQH